MVQYIDPTFCEEYQRIYISSGMIEEAINLDKHKVSVVNGISTRIAVMFFQEGGMTREYIIIQANAKQLKSKYFEGITLHNVEDLYHYIMQLQVIYVPLETFIHESLVSDIDIAYDVNITPKGLGDAISALYTNIKPSAYRLVGKPFRQKTNVGLQFNIRDKATPAKPFIKIYHKSLELEFKSIDFFEAFIKEQAYDNIGRLEFTIKNSKHRKKLNLHNMKTFFDLLTTSSKTLENIVFSGLLKYINKQDVIREYRDLSPTDRLILYFIDKYISSGADRQSIMNVLNQFDVPQERSRMKKKITLLLDNVHDEKVMIANQEARNFLRQIKIQL